MKLDYAGIYAKVLRHHTLSCKKCVFLNTSICINCVDKSFKQTSGDIFKL